MENDENKNLIDDTEEAHTGMEEINDFDFDRASMLMAVMEKVANVAPKSQAISGLAAAALNEMNEEAKAIAKRRAEAFAKLEAAKAEEAAAEARERYEDEQAQIKKDKEDADNAARAPLVTTPKPVPGTQSQAPAPSKTNETAVANGRRA